MEKSYKLYHGDCLDELKNLQNDSIDSIVTDPPYGLSFMGKKWDYDVPSQEIWEECLRVLKPGGHLLAFAGSRTYHRMAVRIEDAGFDIRDQIMWVYGSGFPKSHNIGKAVDKLQGNDREVVGENPNHRNTESDVMPLGFQGGRSDGTITKGNSPYEGWGTALKPAHEPIVMARKPFKGSVAENVLEWGTGGINVDGCRISVDIDREGSNAKRMNKTYSGSSAIFGQADGDTTFDGYDKGRFPANIMFDEEAGKILDEQSGVSKSVKRKNESNTISKPNIDFGGGIKNENNEYNDIGGASRFFYCPKANKSDRNEGCDALEEKEQPHSTNMKCGNCNKLILSGNGNSCKCENKIEVRHKAKNHHPTVKPTELMTYLVRLVTPKGGVVLDPFMGSGSTGKACIREGFQFVGIEREEEYIQIAEQRIEWEYKQQHPHNWF